MSHQLTGAASAAVRAAVTEILNGEAVDARDALADLNAGELLIAVERLEQLARIGRDLMSAPRLVTT